MQNIEHINFGLKPTPRDPRDFKLGAITRLPNLDELPDAFSLALFNVKDQKSSDFCSAFASCGMSEIQENTELEPAWSFAVSKIISGGVDEWGQDMRSALQAHVKYGAVRKFFANYDKGDELRHISYYPDQFDDAKQYKKQSFFKITGQYDAFDNIRAAIWLYREKKRAVALGFLWGWGLKETDIRDISNSGFGHMVYAYGWSPRGLMIRNSYGEEAGVRGTHYFSREVVNNAVNEYGSYCFIDLPSEEAKKTWTIWQRIYNWWIKLLARFS